MHLKKEQTCSGRNSLPFSPKLFPPFSLTVLSLTTLHEEIKSTVSAKHLLRLSSYLLCYLPMMHLLRYLIMTKVITYFLMGIWFCVIPSSIFTQVWHKPAFFPTSLFSFHLPALAAKPSCMSVFPMLHLGKLNKFPFGLWKIIMTLSHSLCLRSYCYCLP